MLLSFIVILIPSVRPAGSGGNFKPRLPHPRGDPIRIAGDEAEMGGARTLACSVYRHEERHLMAKVEIIEVHRGSLEVSGSAFGLSSRSGLRQGVRAMQPCSTRGVAGLIGWRGRDR